jgi:hypothetical protein
MVRALSGTVSRLKLIEGVCLSPVCLPTSDLIRPVALDSAAAVPVTSSSEPYTV